MLLSRQDRREAAEGAGYLLIGLVTLVVIVFLVAALVWWLGVASSGTKGRGDVIRQNNDANNRIAAENEFNQLWGDIQADHDNIKATTKALAVNPADTWQQSVLAAQQQTCRAAVQKYNADTQDMTMRDWRPAADPTTIDSATECEAQP